MSSETYDETVYSQKLAAGMREVIQHLESSHAELSKLIDVTYAVRAEKDNETVDRLFRRVHSIIGNAYEADKTMSRGIKP